MLAVKNLTVALGDENNFSEIVKDFSFNIAKGETLGLSGESGCGKTITSLAIMQLLNKTKSKVKGDILFTNGNSVINLNDTPEKSLNRIRGKDIAMIFQEPMSALNPVIKCGNQIAEVLIKHEGLSFKESYEKTLVLLDKVNIQSPKELFQRYPHELSGGQLQRMVIAMAISCNPKLLIADEPTTALDVTTQKVVLKLLKNIQEEYQTAMLFISHDLKVIERMTDRVVVMQKGRLVEENTTAALFKNPVNEYTQMLIAAQPTELKISTKSKSEKEPHENKLVIKTNSLTKRYPYYKSVWEFKTNYFDAVKNISFELHQGETLGIAGESGSGKSTLARLLLQLIPSDCGEIYFQNQKIHFYNQSNKISWRKNIQIVFQHPHHALDPLMPIGKVIEEPLIAFSNLSTTERKTKVMNWLTKVGLTEKHFHSLPSELSTGQKQRVCIAKALIIQPEVVVFDEAVSALDVTVQSQILKLISQLKEYTPFSSIFISHNMEVLKLVCDRILIMQNGEIIEQGETEKIFTHPEEPYTRQLIDSII